MLGVEAQQRLRYTSDMQRWEYMTFGLVKRKNEIEELNRLGREGWEAVAMVSSWGVGWRFVHPIVLLKRPRPNDAEGSPGYSAVIATDTGASVSCVRLETTGTDDERARARGLIAQAALPHPCKSSSAWVTAPIHATGRLSPAGPVLVLPRDTGRLRRSRCGTLGWHDAVVALPSTSRRFPRTSEYPHHSRSTFGAGPVELSARSGLLGVVGDTECGVDAAGEVVDEVGELGDRVQRAVFAPAGDVGDGFAGDVQAEAAEHEQGGGFLARGMCVCLSPNAALARSAVTALSTVLPTSGRGLGWEGRAVETEPKARRAEVESRRRARRSPRGRPGSVIASPT